MPGAESDAGEAVNRDDVRVTMVEPAGDEKNDAAADNSGSEQAAVRRQATEFLEANGRYRCDACYELIVGMRYHCVECDDFDLCESCAVEEGGAAAHLGNGHHFLALPDTSGHTWTTDGAVSHMIEERIKHARKERAERIKRAWGSISTLARKALALTICSALFVSLVMWAYYEFDPSARDVFVYECAAGPNVAMLRNESFPGCTFVAAEGPLIDSEWVNFRPLGPYQFTSSTILMNLLVYVALLVAIVGLAVPLLAATKCPQLNYRLAQMLVKSEPPADFFDQSTSSAVGKWASGASDLLEKPSLAGRGLTVAKLAGAAFVVTSFLAYPIVTVDGLAFLALLDDHDMRAANIVAVIGYCLPVAAAIFIFFLRRAVLRGSKRILGDISDREASHDEVDLGDAVARTPNGSVGEAGSNSREATVNAIDKEINAVKEKAAAAKLEQSTADSLMRLFSLHEGPRVAQGSVAFRRLQVGHHLFKERQERAARELKKLEDRKSFFFFDGQAGAFRQRRARNDLRFLAAELGNAVGVQDSHRVVAHIDDIKTKTFCCLNARTTVRAALFFSSPANVARVALGLLATLFVFLVVTNAVTYAAIVNRYANYIDTFELLKPRGNGYFTFTMLNLVCAAVAAIPFV